LLILFVVLHITGTLNTGSLTSYPKLGSNLSTTYNECFVKALTTEAERDKEIVAVHAGMGMDQSFQLFQSRFPERFFDVGLAEQHAVTFAAGLSCGGLKPFCIIPSTFLQRAYDQVQIFFTYPYMYCSSLFASVTCLHAPHTVIICPRKLVSF